MSFNILCLVEKTDDSIAYYRAVLPFVSMTKDYVDIKVDFVNPAVTAGWDLLCNYDILFVQRPAAKIHFDWIAQARMHRMKIWIDHDDELWSVNFHSPAFNHYSTEEVQIYIRKCMEYADVITVSTGYLAKSVLDNYGHEAVVLKNACDSWMMYRAPGLKPYSPVVNWRGSHTHKEDLMAHKDDFLLVDEKADVEWVFRGYNETLLSMHLKSHRHVLYMPHTLYLETLRKEPGNIMFTPLVDNRFNRSKSNIAALEAICCGMIPVVPDWWEDLDVYCGTMGEKLLACINESQEKRDEKWRKLMAVVNENYNLYDVNAERHDIVTSL